MTNIKVDSDSLGTRMKQYENTVSLELHRRLPVIIRIDGKAFHTFSKIITSIDPACVNSPFSHVMHNLMVHTTKALVENVQNCVLGYTQSDEISLVLRDWDTYQTQQWFGGNLQKMVSVSASVATAHFNQHLVSLSVDFPSLDINSLGLFDSRAYTIPMDEVSNYLIWRQQDASRNSVQMLGHYHFSQQEMHGKSNAQIQDMLMIQKGINWNDVDVWMKRGTCVYKSDSTIVDENIPIFTQDKEYISTLMMTQNEKQYLAELKQLFLKD
jgi:tRNA(His) guanylyltransferase